MIRRSFAAACFVSCLVTSLWALAAEPLVTEGRVSAVTVYQGQALVTRELEAPAAQGLLEVVVTNLPDNVLPGSLFAEPSDGVQIGSVRFRALPVLTVFDEPIRVASPASGE